MRKIPSLFRRNYDTGRVYPEITPGCGWVTSEGRATVKFDGTACLLEFGRLFRRYDRKLRKFKRGKRPDPPYTDEQFKTPPNGWTPCEGEPDRHTGHWPGWVPVQEDDPRDRYHLEALKSIPLHEEDGTFELVGPKVQGNPYGLDKHELWRHGRDDIATPLPDNASPETLFVVVRTILLEAEIEGIVWHHPDGRMAKVKRRDFGIHWPPRAT